MKTKSHWLGPYEKYLMDSRRLPAREFVIKYFGLAVIVMLIPFTINDFYVGRYNVAGADAAAILLILADVSNVRFRNRVLFPRSLLMACVSAVLLYLVFEQGIMAIYWSYPFVSALFFVLSGRAAVLVFFAFLLGMVPLSYRAVGELETYRVIVTMGLCGVVAYVFSFIVASQKRFLEELAITDSLTGAYNRRHLHKRIEELVNERNRYARNLSQILFDIDYFKKINDQYGHEYGDDILRDIANIVHSRVRASDQLFRHGGDEFTLLLPNTNLGEAAMIADQIRQLVAESGIKRRGPVSISCGVAEIAAMEEIKSWMNRADLALYQAKGEGRNTVSLANPNVADTNQERN